MIIKNFCEHWSAGILACSCAGKMPAVHWNPVACCDRIDFVVKACLLGIVEPGLLDEFELSGKVDGPYLRVDFDLTLVRTG